MKYTQKDAVKFATLGLIGDRADGITTQELISRVKDQCDRLGIYEPSRANLVSICQELSYKFTSLDYMRF
ncbi:hypothetical protein LCGC14_2207600 [marine sediment metagenome]|uniref:Uncharacterized protein n=1 Tax=marine sediment metagenome TaxID=412755 RepID=A0A0F9DEM4_9ZZZZ